MLLWHRSYGWLSQLTLINTLADSLGGKGQGLNGHRGWIVLFLLQLVSFRGGVEAHWDMLGLAGPRCVFSGHEHTKLRGWKFLDCLAFCKSIQ